MTYISSDGTIHQGSTPWRAWILKLFWGVINFIIMFFKSLFNPELHKKGSRYTTDYRPNGRGPPPPPRRRLGGFGTGGQGNLAGCGGGPMAGG